MYFVKINAPQVGHYISNIPVLCDLIFLLNSKKDGQKIELYHIFTKCVIVIALQVKSAVAYRPNPYGSHHHLGGRSNPGTTLNT